MEKQNFLITLRKVNVKKYPFNTLNRRYLINMIYFCTLKC